MSDSPDALAPLAAPPALAAFLKGVERRGAVLAELQAGEAGIGDAALTRAMAAFRPHALEQPMARWPQLFWCEVLRQPALQRTRHAGWPADLPMAASTPGVRAAVLLRLVAGLEEDAAADVLGVAADTLRRALAQAMPRTAGGAPDAAAWTRLRNGLQQRVRDIPTERALRLARGREAALAGAARHFFPAPPPRLAPRLAAVGAVAALALGATWWFERGASADANVDTAELAPAGRPASRYAPAAGLVAHPDFALLADPDVERIARDVAFLSWSAAQADAATAPVDPLAPTLPEPPATYQETADAP